MKVTKSQLKQIIKEELEAVMDEGPPPATCDELTAEYNKLDARQSSAAQTLNRGDEMEWGYVYGLRHKMTKIKDQAKLQLCKPLSTEPNVATK